MVVVSKIKQKLFSELTERRISLNNNTRELTCVGAEWVWIAKKGGTDGRKVKRANRKGKYEISNELDHTFFSPKKGIPSELMPRK